jgi:hypothetical protein
MENIKRVNKFIGTKLFYDEDGVEHKLPQFESTIINANFIQKYLPPKGVYMLVPKHFSAADRQVLDYLEIIMDDTNKAHSPATEIGVRLQMAVPTVYNCLMELRKNDFIKKKSNSYYMINPVYAAKCKAKIKSELIEEYCAMNSKNGDDSDEN